MAFIIQIFTVGLFYSAPLSANPEYISGGEVLGVVGKPRNSLVVVFNVGTLEHPDLRMQRPTVVPLGDQGKILWFKDQVWQSEPLVITDKIIVEKDMLGAAVRRHFTLDGCIPTNGDIVRTVNGTAWLASCNDTVTRTLNKNVMRVVYDEPANSVSSRFYRYKFKPENQMLFSEVALRSGSNQVVARDSDLYIRADVRNFFSLNFSSRDIESKMMDHRVEPLAALASLGFYLKILFFRLTLDLRTDVAFFESAANIPMVMTLPVDAQKRLHPKSGVLYSFELGDGVRKGDLNINMPVLMSDSISGDFIGKGKSYCRELCLYDISLKTSEKTLKMQISIARHLVEKGFFPWYVDDVAAAKQNMNWALKQQQLSKQRVGIYFEVSKLPKGSHPWDFWISF
jgi:hypothetical protein